MPEPKEKRCTCPQCKWDSHIRGVIRRGDKFEMRAMIRELHETNQSLGQELDAAQELLHALTCQCENVEKVETVH